MRVVYEKRNNHTSILVKATHPLLHFLHTVVDATRALI